MENFVLKILWPHCLHLASAEACDLGLHKQPTIDSPVWRWRPGIPCTIPAPHLGEQGTLFVKQPSTRGGNFKGSSCILRAFATRKLTVVVVVMK